MYEDINNSLQKALKVQRWNEGDKFHRIGQPFQWIDADITSGHHHLGEFAAIMPHLTMIYEQYPTPNEIRTSDFDEVRDKIRTVMINIFRQLFPFLLVEKYQQYFDATSLTRAQDFGFIKSFSSLPKRGMKHLDIGPGLGSHSFYSLKIFDSMYCGLEAYPQTYQVQRNVYRLLSNEHSPYLDIIEAESFGISDEEIRTMLIDKNKGIVHMPSWKFPIVKDGFFDLVTATWVLNEVNLAGIGWLICHCSRSLKDGGYLYIRDSDKRKPGRHQINYDGLLVDLGFEEVKRLQVRNRVDLYGVPRIYKKTDRVKTIGFEDLISRLVGHFVTTSNPLDSSSLQRTS